LGTRARSHSARGAGVRAMNIWHLFVMLIAPSMAAIIWLSFIKIPGKNCPPL
jgi:hypothetical protein